MTPPRAIDHVQLVIPEGAESVARQFYGDLLGLTEIAKPPHLVARGGCWFALGTQQLHLGADACFRPATRAHVALVTDALDTLRARLDGAGHLVQDDEPFDGRHHFFSADPFGNRIEFIDGTAQG